MSELSESPEAPVFSESQIKDFHPEVDVRVGEEQITKILPSSNAKIEIIDNYFPSHQNPEQRTLEADTVISSRESDGGEYEHEAERLVQFMESAKQSGYKDAAEFMLVGFKLASEMKTFPPELLQRI